MFSKQLSLKNNINSSIISCKSYIRTINDVTCERNTILNWFKVLCENLTQIINLINKYYKENKNELKTSIQNTLLLYLSQTLSNLSFLINILVREEEIRLILTEARKCVIKQIDWCLDSIKTTINTESVLSDPLGNFVKWMDLALEKISEIDVALEKEKIIQIFKDTQVVFEEVLSHAMSIAQVSLPEDSKSIRGGSQSVLTTLNSLLREIHNGVINGAMVNLFVNACSDKLCILERKVNTAVLTLCMKTFSDFTEPLEKIRNFCFNPENRDKSEEFDGLVADFDLHVDRIMQIGLFAVSCSSDFARGIRIRSCLASLEALESELVPSLHAVLTENSEHNVNCGNLLVAHWLNQASFLKQLIYLIIDPFAFCQIIYDESVEIVVNLSLLIKKKKFLKTKDLDYFIKIIKVLKEFLNKAQTEFSDLEKEKIEKKLKDFNDVVAEVESATNILLNMEIANLESSLRVLKRCKIVLTVMKRLWYCFIDDFPNKSKTICEEKSVKEMTGNFENVNVGNPFLDHIINRGKQILQDRSILYKSPVKQVYKHNEEKSTIFNTNRNERKEIPLLKQMHLRKLSFNDVGLKAEGSLDLQITNILNEITNLSMTFNKE